MSTSEEAPASEGGLKRHLSPSYKRARTISPASVNGRAHFVPAEPTLGKRQGSPPSFSPAKRARTTPTPSAPSAASEKTVELTLGERAAQWVVYDLLGKLKDHPELLQYLEQRIEHYATATPAHLPPPRPKPRKRSASPQQTPEGKKTRTGEGYGEMDVDDMPAMQPRRTPLQPQKAASLGFARFAADLDNPKTSPFRTQPAAFVPLNAATPPRTPVLNGKAERLKATPGFSSYATKSARFTTRDLQSGTDKDDKLQDESALKVPRAGESQETAIDLEKSPREPFSADGNLHGAAADSGPDATNVFDGDRAAFRTRQGDKAMLAGEYLRAITWYRDALKVQPESLTIRVKLSRGLLANGEFKQALASLDVAMRTQPIPAQPKDAEIPGLLDAAAFCFECCLFKKAAEVYEAILAVDPANDAAANGIIDCDRVKHVGQQATALLVEEQWQRCLDFLDKEIKALKRAPVGWHVQRLQSHLEIRPINWVLVTTLTKQLEDDGAEDATACYLVGSWAWLNKDETRAQRWWRRAQNVGHPVDDGHIYLRAARELRAIQTVRSAMAEFRSSGYRQAMSLYTEILAKGLATPWLYCLRAACHIGLHHYEHAIEDCLLALEMQADLYLALERQAFCELHLGKKLADKADYAAAMARYAASEILYGRALASFRSSPQAAEPGATQWIQDAESGKLEALCKKVSAQARHKEAQARAQAKARESAKPASGSESSPRPGFYAHGANPRARHSWNSAREGFTSFDDTYRPPPRQSYARQESSRESKPKPQPSPRGSAKRDPLARDYETLGLAFGAPLQDVKNAFLRLSKVKHPDKGGSNEAFQELVNARDGILSKLGHI